MRIRQTIAVVAALIALLATTARVSHAQFEAEEASFTIGTDAALKLDKSQLKELIEKKGLGAGSKTAQQITKRFTGQGVKLDELNEKEVLDLWKVLTPEQRDDLAGQIKPALPVSPEELLGTAIPFWKGGPSPFHIPPSETQPPVSLFRNGSQLPIDLIKSIGARKSEADACESASVPARLWVGASAIEPDRIASYEQSLSNWINACLTQDTNDNASLAGLDATLITQVVGVLSYGSTRFCTGLLKDGMVITAKHCFMATGEPDVGISAQWWCPKIAGHNDLWCARDEVRKTLQFRRASDPSNPIPLSLEEVGITAPANFSFKSDRISIAVRADNPVSLSSVPKVEWDAPKLNELVWLVGPVVSATQPDKYQGVYWSKFLDGKCRIVEVQGQCVRHYCQAVGGFSGSPMVTRTTVEGGESIVKVAGFHLGASASYKDCKSNKSRLNIAQKAVQ